MTKAKTSTESTRRGPRKPPKAATLYGYLRNYFQANDIGEDASIGVVMQNLRDSIVEESQTE